MGKVGPGQLVLMWLTCLCEWCRWGLLEDQQCRPSLVIIESTSIVFFMLTNWTFQLCYNIILICCQHPLAPCFLLLIMPMLCCCLPMYSFLFCFYSLSCLWWSQYKTMNSIQNYVGNNFVFIQFKFLMDVNQVSFDWVRHSLGQYLRLGPRCSLLNRIIYYPLVPGNTFLTLETRFLSFVDIYLWKNRDGE